MREALDWYERQPTEGRSTLVTGYRKKNDGPFGAATSSWVDYLEHEKQALAEWRRGATGSVRNVMGPA